MRISAFANVAKTGLLRSRLALATQGIWMSKNGAVVVRLSCSDPILCLLAKHEDDATTRLDLAASSRERWKGTSEQACGVVQTRRTGEMPSVANNYRYGKAAKARSIPC